MMEGFGEIMTLEGTAKYLKIGKSTLYKMAREGKIPGVKESWHRNSETIEIYAHVNTKNLSAINNPLDSLLAGGGP